MNNVENIKKNGYICGRLFTMGNKISDTIRKRIAEEMAKRKWNQVKLSAESGVNQGQISTLLAGTPNRRFNDELIDKIAAAFGLDSESLVAPPQCYPPTIERIIKYYNIDAYRKGVDYFEDQVFMGCIQNGLITPEKNDTEP